MNLAPMANRLPTGPGSRGGLWWDPDFRRTYHRAWRAAHPDYREREALRRARARAAARGEPTIVAEARLAPGRLPEAAASCACGCGCREAVATCCGFCRDGMHAA